jgi:hypothetical protein
MLRIEYYVHREPRLWRSYHIYIYTNTTIRTPPPPLRKIRYIGTSVYDIVSIISLLLLLLFTTIIIIDVHWQWRWRREKQWTANRGIS